ncbi:hypothetical protein WJX81_008090 [Elliptochloris bilobata]|uniref:Uncharacterized protein n=1 Tax=Elliptochloris bilobata TaxID=381761 RepID=A0AAW1RBL8_9CHLO
MRFGTQAPASTEECATHGRGPARPPASPGKQWAVGKLINQRILDASSPEALLDVVDRELPAFNTVNLSTAVYCMGKMKADAEALALVINSPSLNRLIDTITAKLIKGFKPQELAIFLWAWATLGEQLGGACLAALVKQAQKELPRFNSQNLANTAWALATMRVDEPALMSSIAGVVSTRLANSGATIFNIQELANLCWAFAKAKEDNPRTGPTIEVQLEAHRGMVVAAARALAARAGEADAQDLSNTAWALARFRYDDAATIGTLACEACKRLDASRQPAPRKLVFKQQEMSKLVYAHAVLGIVPERLARACVGELKCRLPHELFSMQHLANLVWSLCILQACDLELWRIAMASVSAQWAPAQITVDGLRQIFQAYELLRLDMPAAEAALAAAAPPGLLDAARVKWAMQAQEGNVSNFQYDVARVLRSRGVAHQLEALTSDGLFSVDIALPGERIALEADGRTTSHVPYYLWFELSDGVRGAWLLQEEESYFLLQPTLARWHLPTGANRTLDRTSPCLEVLKVVVRELPLFCAVNMATSVSRLGKMKADAEALALAIESPSFKRLIDTITRRAGELSARNVANILRGFATMGHHPGIWACAKLEYHPGAALLQAYAAEAAKVADGFNPQALANLLWAWVTLGEQLGGACLAALVKRAQKLLPCFNWKWQTQPGRWPPCAAMNGR